MKNSKLLLTGFILLLPAFAAAQDQDQAAEQAQGAEGNAEHPCSGDMTKYCADTISGSREEQVSCLQEHVKQLSVPCKAKMDKFGGGNKKSNNKKSNNKKSTKKSKETITENHPCAPDMDNFCSDVKGMPGKDLKCLMSHSADLSKECRNRLRKDHAKKQKKIV